MQYLLLEQVITSMENKRLKGVVQMGRIKPPFAYFGSKGRFYKEIKEIFQANYRANFVDLFAGSMEIPLNFKNEFGELKVFKCER